MWNGAFAPVKKSSSENDCDHGSTKVDVVEGIIGVEIRVQFNHSCGNGLRPPSNSTTYVFQYDGDIGIKDRLAEMSESDKLAWVSNNLVWDES